MPLPLLVLILLRQLVLPPAVMRARRGIFFVVLQRRIYFVVFNGTLVHLADLAHLATRSQCTKRFPRTGTLDESSSFYTRQQDKQIERLF